MQHEDGATIIWPACGYGGHDCKWGYRNVSHEDRQLSCDDAVIESSNCFHAGSANHSNDIRHVITLVFVNTHQYNDQNNRQILG